MSAELPVTILTIGFASRGLIRLNPLWILGRTGTSTSPLPPVPDAAAVRRPSVRIVLTLVAVLSAATAGAQNVDDIVAQNVAAKGGAERLRAISTVKATGRVRIQGADASVTTYGKRPNLVRQEVTIGGRTEIVAFDGTSSWTIAPLSGSPTPAALDGATADRIRDQADFDGPLVDWRAKGSTIESVSAETTAGRTLRHLRIVTRHQRVLHVYLDAATGLEARVVREGPGGDVQEDLSDYRTVQGVTVPFSVKVSFRGALVSEMTVTALEFNLPTADSLFVMPR